MPCEPLECVYKTAQQMIRPVHAMTLERSDVREEPEDVIEQPVLRPRRAKETSFKRKFGSYVRFRLSK